MHLINESSKKAFDSSRTLKILSNKSIEVLEEFITNNPQFLKSEVQEQMTRNHSTPKEMLSTMKQNTERASIFNVKSYFQETFKGQALKDLGFGKSDFSNRKSFATRDAFQNGLGRDRSKTTSTGSVGSTGNTKTDKRSRSIWVQNPTHFQPSSSSTDLQLDSDPDEDSDPGSNTSN